MVHSLTLGYGHGQQVPLKIAIHDAPFALVDCEGGLATHASVVVGLRHNPCRGIRYSEVKHLALDDESMETIYDFLDGSGVVPPVDVKDINVVDAQLLERGVDRVYHRFEVVADKSAVLTRLSALVVGRILAIRTH